ncbi:unnamed protein product [Phytophthora fragariaefolia]|uniref:Unnamed protein product n=1 Tax=Phytophthora fragariaefolia TaxID=1490495 RepID=A0A9W6WUT4_9STRA|nr:unnamed protein product [Phytophthora fragariaefolia]
MKRFAEQEYEEEEEGVEDEEEDEAKKDDHNDGAGTQKKKVCFLCDGPPMARRGQMVVFVSPNEDWMRKTEKDGSFLYMPLWTPDELQRAAMVLNLDVNDTDIDERYRIFGGIARQCLCRDSRDVVIVKQNLLEVIRESTNGDDLQNLLLGMTLGALVIASYITNLIRSNEDIEQPSSPLLSSEPCFKVDC